MKLFTVVFLVCCSFFVSINLSATVVNDNNELVQYCFEIVDNELFFNFKISSELKLGDTYNKHIMKDRLGLGCSATCSPFQSGTIFSQEGYILEDVNFSVYVQNTDELNKVLYEITIACIYTGTSKEGDNVKARCATTSKGFFISNQVDVEQHPKLFQFINAENEGCITFKLKAA